MTSYLFTAEGVPHAPPINFEWPNKRQYLKERTAIRSRVVDYNCLDRNSGPGGWRNPTCVAGLQRCMGEGAEVTSYPLFTDKNLDLCRQNSALL